jgi:UMF1 family MFS transporter
MERETNVRRIVAWCFYDWANTAFSTVIVTFVYSVFFQRSIGDPDKGSAIWAWALSASGLLTALLAPPTGAAADHYGHRRRWLALFLFIAVGAIALLWFGTPSLRLDALLFILTLVVCAGTATELGAMIANGMLPSLAPRRWLGRISGFAWGMGYAGGLVCLNISLFGFVGLGKIPPIIPLPHAAGENIRAVTLLVAAWCLVFSLPLLITADDQRTGMTLGEAIRHGLADLRETVLQTRKNANLVRFLVASAIYRDGLNTLFTVGGLYAAGTLGMSFQDLLIFAIGLNITAGLGAAVFAVFDDWRGSKPTIVLSLISLLVLGSAILAVSDKRLFLALALLLGIFMGPVQAASRTLVARIAPPAMVNQTFGLYALTGKALAFLGPLCFGWATLLSHSQRVGMATILLFWLTGLLLVLKVTVNNAPQSGNETAAADSRTVISQRQ